MSLESWVESANNPLTDFPIQNLPYGVFSRGKNTRIGIAIGDQILDLCACAEAGLLDALPSETVLACQKGTLNTLMSLGCGHWAALRHEITGLLEQGSAARLHQGKVEPMLVPVREVTMQLPASIGDYTDFYASIHHATSVGRLFRPDNPLLPNYKYVPIGYHGRASSILVSGNTIARPFGQTKAAKAEAPIFGTSNALDYELELGFFAGTGNQLGHAISITHAEQSIFGVCLVNDWSARDIQAWEYQPLGPFLAKNFATTISPWMVPLEALAPFRTAAFEREPGDPAPLPYLSSSENQMRGGLDLIMEVYLSSERMRIDAISPYRVSRSNASNLYWTMAQLLTHHTSNGCNIRPGDLLASGTISGPAQGSQGCLLEITKGGVEPFSLPSGETRTYLEDGDQVTLHAYCEKEGHPRIGFGECRGTIAPAIPNLR